MDALVAAGGIPEEGEPLYEFTQGKPKALLEVAGKPMIQWVLDALAGSEKIDGIVVIGLDETESVQCEKITAYVPNQGGLLENARAGMLKVLELRPDAKQVVVASSDIPAITSEMVDWMVDNSKDSDLDLHYHVVTREVMEKRYPQSNRSYIRLKDLEVCGGDMNVVRAMAVTANEERLERIIESRKSIFRQAALIGYGTLLLLLLGRLDVDGAIERVTKRMDITGKVVLNPYAEIAMDADKPHQLKILRADMTENEGAAGT
jgi:GTP:adenosylcobinamide-phosphate guanylyltransferase